MGDSSTKPIKRQRIMPQQRPKKNERIKQATGLPPKVLDRNWAWVMCLRRWSIRLSFHLTGSMAAGKAYHQHGKYKQMGFKLRLSFLRWRIRAACRTSAKITLKRGKSHKNHGKSHKNHGKSHEIPMFPVMLAHFTAGGVRWGREVGHLRQAAALREWRWGDIPSCLEEKNQW